MRDYAKISPRFWIGSTGRKLRDAGPEATLVAVYLLSNPHANMLGLYYLPEPYIAHETGLGIEGASEGLRRAIEAVFCAYDAASEVVFVYEMARFQVAARLEARDKRCAGIQREYDALPDNPFLPMFYEKYADAFHLKNRRDPARSSQGASKTHRSQEQEQEQKQELEKTPSAADASASDDSEPLDPRHSQIRQLIQELHLRQFRLKCQWDGSEGKALDRLLLTNPSWTEVQIAEMVRNRFASEGVTATRPRAWLSRLDDYVGGSLDRYNKLKGLETNGHGNRNGNRENGRQECTLHLDSGLTQWGTCWGCYSAKHSTYDQGIDATRPGDDDGELKTHNAGPEREWGH
jgi:hypothetical protein